MQIKVLSLNLHCGMEEDYDTKLEQIILGCVQENPDILFLQECVQHREHAVIDHQYGVRIKEGNLGVIIKEQIEEQLKCVYDFFFDWGKYGFNVLEEGLCIISKLPIVEAKSRYVSVMQDVQNWKSRKIIRVKTKYNDQDIFFYNVHLGWWDDGEDTFAHQFAELDKWIKEEPDGVHILAGDFNNPQGDLGYWLMEAKGYRDLYYEANPRGYNDKTFIEQKGQSQEEEGNIGRRIDYVMTPNQQLRVEGMTRIFTETRYGIVSDHYGLAGELEFI